MRRELRSDAAGGKILSVVEWADHVEAASISPVRSSLSASISVFCFLWLCQQPVFESREGRGWENLDYDLVVLLAASL